MEVENIKFKDVPLPDTSFGSSGDTFVNREFMRYYPVRQAITDVAQLPTSPNNFYEQIQLAEIAGVFSLYIYISNSWKKIDLT